MIFTVSDVCKKLMKLMKLNWLML